MEIKIANISTNADLDICFDAIVKTVSETQKFNDNVSWNFCEVSDMHPFYAFALATYKHNKNGIVLKGLSNELNNYLRDICFEKTFNFVGNNQIPDYYSTLNYIPVCSIPIEDSGKDVFVSLARDIILKQLKSPAGITTPLSYFMSELIDNIYEHSESENCFLFSEFIQSENTLYLCIADSGITIYKSFEKRGLFQQEINGDESDALRLANEGCSSKKRPGAENRGYGISTSKRMLVEGLGGSFFMLSGNAFHRYENKTTNYFATMNQLFRWNGTMVLLRIPVDVPEGFNYVNYLE